MATRPTSDDSALERHTRGVPVGRVRPATLDETESRDAMLRPDAVLALTGAVPADIGPFEQHVAGLIDGVRPVARLRKKSGVSSADLRIALGSLLDRKLLRLVGVVEEAIGELAREIEKELALQQDQGLTDPTGRHDVIPHNVMADIQSMLEELDNDDNNKS